MPLTRANKLDRINAAWEARRQLFGELRPEQVASYDQISSSYGDLVKDIGIDHVDAAVFLGSMFMDTHDLVLQGLAAGKFDEDEMPYHFVTCLEAMMSVAVYHAIEREKTDQIG